MDDNRLIEPRKWCKLYNDALATAVVHFSKVQQINQYCVRILPSGPPDEHAVQPTKMSLLQVTCLWQMGLMVWDKE